MLPLPNVLQEFVNRAGIIKNPWIQYLQQFTIPPPNFIDVTLTGSPFEYVAREPGSLFVSGGTISLITLTRGTETLTVTGSILIPVGIADIVEVTYSVLPTVKFIPSYGVDTHNY